MYVDIRSWATKISGIRFSDDIGGTAKATRLEEGAGPQVNIKTRAGDYVYVRYQDIDHLCKALQLAKEKWGES